MSAEQILDAQVLADVMGAAVKETDDANPDPVASAPEASPASAPAAASPEAQPSGEPARETEVPAQERLIKWRGQEVKVDPGEVDRLIQQGFDYTQKTMELANFRRAADEQVTTVMGQAKAQQEAVQALFNDPDKLEAIAAAARARLGLAPRSEATPSDPDEFVSKTELQRLLDQVKRDALEEVNKAKTDVRDNIEMAKMEGDYRADFNRTLDTLVRDKYPLLNEFGGDDIADKLRADAANFTKAFMTLNPGQIVDPERVKQVMAESAKRRHDQIEGRLREREKKSVIARTDLEKKGTEPRGGTAPPAPPSGKPLKLNDPSLDAQVLREIQGIMGQG